jgi:hypothetical protein
LISSPIVSIETRSNKFDGSSLTGWTLRQVFFVEIHIKANARTCRKDSTSCYSFSKVVDSDLCNFKDFVDETVDQFPHGYQELVHVFYYSDVTKASSLVTTDQELLEMFSKHVDSKVVHMTITYTDGCRPYLAIDSTFLTGRFRVQLACAVVVDGHNWMYPVAVGVFDSETSENLKWFLEMLRDAIGLTHGLAICTDAG